MTACTFYEIPFPLFKKDSSKRILRLIEKIQLVSKVNSSEEYRDCFIFKAVHLLFALICSISKLTVTILLKL